MYSHDDKSHSQDKVVFGNKYLRMQALEENREIVKSAKTVKGFSIFWYVMAGIFAFAALVLLMIPNFLMGLPTIGEAIREMCTLFSYSGPILVGDVACLFVLFGILNSVSYKKKMRYIHDFEMYLQSQADQSEGKCGIFGNILRGIATLLGGDDD